MHVPATLSILILIPFQKIKYSQKELPQKVEISDWDFHFLLGTRSRRTRNIELIWFIFNCRALNGGSTMNHRDATQLRRLRAPNFLVPETWRSKNRFRENRPDKYLTPIDCSTSLLKYSRWSLAGSLSLQPAVVAGKKKKNKQFLSPARKASPVSRENCRDDESIVSGWTYIDFATSDRTSRYEDERIRRPKLDTRDFKPSWSETETVRPSELLRRTLSFDLRPSVSLLFSPSPVLFS